MQRHSNPLHGEKVSWVSSKQSLQCFVNRPLYKQEAYWNVTHIRSKVPCCSKTAHFSSGNFQALCKRWEHYLLCFQSAREMNITQGTCSVNTWKSATAFSEDDGLPLVRLILQWKIMAKAIVHYESFKNYYFFPFFFFTATCCTVG